MALITLGLCPFMMLGGILRAKYGGMQAVSTKYEDAYKESNALLSDVIMNYRTVISFGPRNIEYLM